MEGELFPSRRLKSLIVPLVFEQILSCSLGMADTIMVSSAGLSAVTGVTLVDSLNVLINTLFNAIATGGAVVCAQYIGKRDREKATDAAKQLLIATTALILVVTAAFFLFRSQLLSLLFGAIEEDVMRSCQQYFTITLFSYPAIVIYYSGGAIFRAQGNSKVSFMLSAIMSASNIALNALFIYGFKWGVLGAAAATSISRAICCVAILGMLKSELNELRIDSYLKLGFKPKLIGKILSVGIPTGVENGMFQFGKLALQSFVSSLGTVVIAANAFAMNIAQIMNVPGAAFGLSFLTVIGQCCGAGEKQQAKYYLKKIMKIAYVGLAVTTGLLWALRYPLLSLYKIDDPQVISLTVSLLALHSAFAVFIWMPSFGLPYALRAAGDVRYCMLVSIGSMWAVRIAGGILLGSYFGLGIYGVYYAMIADWAVRSVFFGLRVRGGRWLEKSVV